MNEIALSANIIEQGFSWANVLANEKAKPYFKDILSAIDADRAAGKIVYPANKEIFNAFQFTPLENLKVVILGQDPYHGPGQAHGLCFSVKKGVAAPPSLENIYKELKSDLGIASPGHGNLEQWAKEGVLLLNTGLSVLAGQPLSHKHLGWERFTDEVIRVISENLSGIIFLLWGSHAQKKAALIEGNLHHILTAPHPSPLSAHRGFFGCKHFSKANSLLMEMGKTPINWQLSR
jgi:uracil-DNA glycosylase